MLVEEGESILCLVATFLQKFVQPSIRCVEYDPIDGPRVMKDFKHGRYNNSRASNPTTGLLIRWVLRK